MNVEQAIKLAQGLDSERPGVDEAFCIAVGSHHRSVAELSDPIRRAVLALIG